MLPGRGSTACRARQSLRREFRGHGERLNHGASLLNGPRCPAAGWIPGCRPAAETAAPPPAKAGTTVCWVPAACAAARTTVGRAVPAGRRTMVPTAYSTKERMLNIMAFFLSVKQKQAAFRRRCPGGWRHPAWRGWRRLFSLMEWCLKSGHKAGQAAAKAFLHDGGAFFLLNLGLFDQCRYGAVCIV